jgi:lipopolysaccharide export LptBFGC system permease protein LptF
MATSGRPAVLIAAALGGLTHWLSTEIAPSLSFAKKEYLRKVFVEAFRDMNPGQTELSLGEFYLSAQLRESGSNVFRDVTLHVPVGAKRVDGGALGNGTGATILSDRVEFTFPGDRMRIDLLRPRMPDAVGRDLRIDHVYIELNIDELLDVKPRDPTKWRYQGNRNLRGMLQRGEVPEKDVRGAEYEWHARITRTATYFLFLLLGVPTGLLLRRGTQLGALAFAVGYALVYYLLSMRLGKTLAGWGTVPPEVAAWATTGIGTVAGLILCWRAFRR